MNLLPPAIPPRARSRPGSSANVPTTTTTITDNPTAKRSELRSRESNAVQRVAPTGTIGADDRDPVTSSSRPLDDHIQATNQNDEPESNLGGNEVGLDPRTNEGASTPTSPGLIYHGGSSSTLEEDGRMTNPELGSTSLNQKSPDSIETADDGDDDDHHEQQQQRKTVGLNIKNQSHSIDSGSSEVGGSGIVENSPSSSSSSSDPKSTETKIDHPFSESYTVVPDQQPNVDMTPAAATATTTTSSTSTTTSSSDSKRKPSVDSLLFIPTRTTSRILNQPPTPSPDPPSPNPPKPPPLLSTPSPLISPFSSPSLPDGFDPQSDPSSFPTINPAHLAPRSGLKNRGSIRGEERRSEMEGSGLTMARSGVSSPTLTPPEQEGDSVWAGREEGKRHPGFVHQDKPTGAPLQTQTQTTQTTLKPRTGSGSSSTNNIFFKRPLPVQKTYSTNSLHSIASSVQQQGTRPSSLIPGTASATPAAGAGAGYVNARLAREEERRVELEQKRERENRKEGSGTGGLVKDGYKVVDGVEKKRSTSGVYTPVTFPGATGKQRTASATSSLGVPSPGTPDTPFSFQTLTPPPISDSFTNTYFPSRQFPNTSPARAGYSAGEQEAAIGKKRSIIGVLKSPSFTGMKSAMTEGWRRSSADAVPNPSRLDPTAPTLRTRLGSANDVYNQPEGGLRSTGDRLRSASDQPVRPGYTGRAATAVDGLGLALVDRSLIDSGYPIKVPMELLEVSESERASMEVSDTPPLQSATAASLQGRPRNVKNLTLPLSNMHGTAETEPVDHSPTLSAVETFSPGNPVLGVVAKGVRRKPVPQS